MKSDVPSPTSGQPSGQRVEGPDSTSRAGAGRPGVTVGIEWEEGRDREGSGRGTFGATVET